MRSTPAGKDARPNLSRLARLLRPARAAGFCLGLVLGSAVVLAAGLALISTRPGLAKPWLEKALAPEGGTARVQELDLTFNPLTLTLRKVSVTSPQQQEPVLDLEELRLQADLWEGLRHGLWLKRAAISRPRLSLGRLPAAPGAGQGSGPSGGPGEGPAGLPDLSGLKLLLGMDELRLAQGGFRLTLPQGELKLDDLSASLTPAPAGNDEVSSQPETPPRAVFEMEGRLTTRVTTWSWGTGPVLEGRLRARGRLKPGPVLELELTLEEGQAQGSDVGAKLEMKADLGLDRDRLRIREGRLSLGEISFPLPQAGPELAGLRKGLGLDLLVRGWLDLDGQKGHLDLDRGAVSWPGGGADGPDGPEVLNLSGSLERSRTAGLGADLKGNLRISEALWRAVAPLLPGPLRETGFQGRIPIQAGLKRDGLELILDPQGLLLGPAPAKPGERGGLRLEKTRIKLERKAEGAYLFSCLGSLLDQEGEEALEWDGRLQTSSLGGLWVDGLAGQGVTGSLTGGLSRSGPVLAWLGPLLPPSLRSLSLQGPVPFEARLGEGRLALSVNPAGARLRLDKAALGVDLDLGLEGTSLILEGPATGPLELQGKLQAGGSAAGEGWRLGSLEVSAELVGDPLSPGLEGLKLSLPPKAAVWRGKEQPLGKVELRGRAQGGAKTGLWAEIDSLEVEKLGLIRGRFSLEHGRPEAGLEAEALDLAGVAGLLETAGLVPPGWAVGGRAGLSLSLIPGKTGPELAGRIGLTTLSLSSADGGVLMDKLAGGLTFRAGPGLEGEAETSLKVSQGEILVGTVYLNLKGHPLDLTAKIRPRTAAKGSTQGFSRYDLDLAGGWVGLGRFKVRGQVPEEPWSEPYQGRLDLEKADLAFLYQTLVKGPLALTNPALATLKMKGLAGLGMEFRGQGTNLSLKGRLKVEGAGLEEEAGPDAAGASPKGEVLVEGLDLDLPLDYRLGAGGTAAPPEPKKGEWGRLKVQGLKLPTGDRVGLELPVCLKPNRLYVGGGVELDLWGGRLGLSRIMVDRPLSTDFLLSCALDLAGLDLSRLDTGGVALEGSLSGRLEPLELSLQSLKSGGRLQGTVFGGRVEIKNLSAQWPLSPGRIVGADLTFDKLHLEKLSQALDVGRITGRVSGGLEGLKFAYGQPVAFDLKLVSVEEKGVDQRVNLKAVNSISVLGTGAGLQGVGIKVMTAFFKEFPYKKIGIHCKLRNDVFQVKGLIREGDKEYLVRKPVLSGINVVNSNPDNRISFSDMRERLKRITSSEEGPKVE